MDALRVWESDSEALHDGSLPVIWFKVHARLPRFRTFHSLNSLTMAEAPISCGIAKSHTDQGR